MDDECHFNGWFVRATRHTWYCLGTEDHAWRGMEMNKNRPSFNHPENPLCIFVITWKWFLLSFRLCYLKMIWFSQGLKEKDDGPGCVSMSIKHRNILLFTMLLFKQRCIQRHITSDTSHHITFWMETLHFFWQFFSLFIPFFFLLLVWLLLLTTYYFFIIHSDIFIEKMVFVILRRCFFSFFFIRARRTQS